MTLYRDDIQETIAYSNTTMSKQNSVTNELIRIRDDALHRLTVLSGDTVIVTDEIIDSAIFPITEEILLVDEFTGRKLHRDMLTETIVATDTVKAKMRVRTLVHDSIATTTQQQDKQRALSIEHIAVADTFLSKKLSISHVNEKLTLRDFIKAKGIFSDSVLEQFSVTDAIVKHKVSSKTVENIGYQELYQHKKIVRSLVNESVRVSDKTIARYSDHVIEYVQHNEQYSQHLIAKQRVTDLITLNETLNQKRKVKQWLDENIGISETYQTKNYARQFVNDVLFLEDDVPGERYRGFAWTANADTWAMSRYDSYQFHDLTVIDGVLHGINNDGVFRIDVKSPVDAKVVTGKIDLGRGQLIHPTAAYLEYELSGANKSLQMGIGTTQSGGQQTYYYPLPNEQADYLTNGRVLFGRGLRGRHFSFEIKISGESGYINDLSIDMTNTKRRI